MEVQYDPPYRPGYELIAARILEIIAESGLRPEDRMPTEKDLATRLETSRGMAREAVKILSASRLAAIRATPVELRAIEAAVDLCRQLFRPR